MNVSHYTVLDCEPLHDLKGHLCLLLTELPYILEGRPQTLCQDVLDSVVFSKKEGGYTGTDLRVAILEAYKLLYHQNVSDDVKSLVQTAAKISVLFYPCEEKCSPKSVLQLYNCTWMHHELCQRLIHHPRKYTTKAFYVSYLHALAVHASVQYEIVCLRSVNTENQERIFQQAKQ